MFINFFHWASELPWDQINWELVGSVYLDCMIASMVFCQIFANPIARSVYPKQTKADGEDRLMLSLISWVWPIPILVISYNLLKKVKLW